MFDKRFAVLWISEMISVFFFLLPFFVSFTFSSTRNWNCMQRYKCNANKQWNLQKGFETNCNIKMQMPLCRSLAISLTLVYSISFCLNLLNWFDSIWNYLHYDGDGVQMFIHLSYTIWNLQNGIGSFDNWIITTTTTTTKILYINRRIYDTHFVSLFPCETCP